MTDTTTSAPPDEPGDRTVEEPVEDPTPPRPKALTTWALRFVAVALLALAVGILVKGSQRAETAQPTTTGNFVVVKQFPLDGGEALRQTEVGAELQQGFDGRLTINGVAIPEAQMEGVIDPKSPEAANNASGLLRPNNRNRVYFSPGPGKVLEKLPQGKITVKVTYFKDLQPGTDQGAKTWTFDVT
ncbi:hypothetical protein BH10ACT1_BH10ACT1_20890 [soil metagenome]